MLSVEEDKVVDNYLSIKDSKILENIPGDRLSLILEEISRKEFTKEDSVQDNVKVNLKSHPVFQNSLNKILNLGNEDFLNFKRFSQELEQELSISEQNDAVIESMGENLEENFTQVCIKEEEIDQVLGEIRENMDYTVSKSLNRKIAWSSLEENKIPELENSDIFFKEILEKYNTEKSKAEECKVSDIYNQKSFCRFWPSSQTKSLKKNKKRKKKSGQKIIESDVLRSVENIKEVDELRSEENIKDELRSEEIANVKEVDELRSEENIKEVDESCSEEIANVKEADELRNEENSNVKDVVSLEEISQRENAPLIAFTQDIFGLKESAGLDISKEDMTDVSIMRLLSPNLEQDQEEKCENPIQDPSKHLLKLEYIKLESPRKLLQDLKGFQEFGSDCSQKENHVYENVEKKEAEVGSKEVNSHNASRSKLNAGKKKKKKNRTKITAKIMKQEPSPSAKSINLTESIAPSNLSNVILPNSILSDMIRDAPISNDLPMPEYDWNFFPESPSPESFYDHEEIFYAERVADVAVQVTPNSDLSLEDREVGVEEVDFPETFSDVTQTDFESHTHYVEDKNLTQNRYEMADLKEFVSTALHPSDFLKHGLVHKPPAGYTYVYTLGYIPFSREPHPIYILVPLTELDPELQKYFSADLFEKAQAETFLFNRWELAQKDMAMIREQDLSLLSPNSETWLSFLSYLN